MCSKIGVDPLASNKGFWSDLLGVGDFYSELGVQIIQICLQTRATNGGIISLNELYEILCSKPGRRHQNISHDDIKRSIEKISILGNGLKIIVISNRELLLSIPLELTTSHHDLLATATEYGYVSERMMCEQRGWESERFYSVINLMMQEGLAWIDIPSQLTSSAGILLSFLTYLFLHLDLTFTISSSNCYSQLLSNEYL